MSYTPETNKQFFRYLSLLAIVILGVVSILGSGGGGDSTPSPPAAPSVTATSPAGSSDTALVTTEVSARFSEQMAPLTINANSFLLSDSGSRPINASSITFYAQYNGHDNVAVFVPNNDLDIDEVYFATLTTEIENTSGITLARNYVWSFRVAPATVAVSTDAAGNFDNSGVDTSSPSAPNATGEYVVFASAEVPSQIYRKNTITGHIEPVSTTSDNLTLANGPCATPRISDTGRYVVFSSQANNLDPAVTNTASRSHIYLKDMRNGTITLLDKSITNIGEAVNGNSYNPDISGIPDIASGKYVVFESTADDLHADDADTISDIFLINFGGTVELISATADQINDPTDNASYRPRVSDDGNRVVFESLATNLVTGDTNGKSDIFLRNLVTDTTTRISIATDGTQATGGPDGSTHADISADGAFAVFQSDQPNLDGDANGVITDIFLRDIAALSTAILSFADGDANGADNDSTQPSISADGRYIAFESLATDLLGAGNDTNGQSDVFVRDKNSNTIERVSINNLGAEANDASTNAVVSTDGRYISFTTREPFDITDFPSTYDIYRAYNAALP